MAGLTPGVDLDASALTGLRSKLDALRMDADRVAAAIDGTDVAFSGPLRQPAMLQTSSSDRTLEDILRELRSLRTEIAGIGDAVRTGMVVINGTDPWPPPNTPLPAGWKSIPLDVGRLPQDQSLWSPWAGPLPKDGPLILLDRYSRKLSIAAGGAPARVMDYAQLLPPIPPYATGPFPSGPCATTRSGLWGQRESVPAEPQVVTQNEVQQIDLYVRSGESVVQFMGVLNYSWSQLRFVCSDPVNYDGPFLWRDAGVSNSGIVWQSRLTTVSW